MLLRSEYVLWFSNIIIIFEIGNYAIFMENYFINLNITFDIDYLPLLIVIATAWSIPMLLSVVRLSRVPIVIVEIIAGYFIGKYLLDNYSGGGIFILEFLALTGFIFLMFLGGLEIDVDQIIVSFPKKRITIARFLKNPLLIGLLFFCITLLLSYGSAWLLTSLVKIRNIWYFSLIMITTSVGIIIPVLKNNGEINSRFGQMIVVAAAIADILSIILFTYTAYIISNGLQVDILLIFLLFILFFVFYRIGLSMKRIRFFKKITYQLSHAASQIQIRGTLLLIFIFVVVAQFIGKEAVLLGAFLCGLLLSFFLHKERSLLILNLDGMGYGFFIPVFFIMVGAEFDPEALAAFDNSLYPFLFLLLITLVAVKLVPAFLWQRLFGTRRAIAGGFLMGSRLSLIIAASQIGLGMGIISPGINSCVLIMAIITCFVSPLIYNYLQPTHSIDTNKTIIIGGSSTGVLLARRMKMHGKAAILIEKQHERYSEMSSKGLNTLIGDGTKPALYEDLKLSPYNYVVVLTGDDCKNLKVCKTLKEELGHEKIISRASKPEIIQKLKNLEVETLDTIRIMATTIENLILRPTIYHTLIETFENYSVEEIVVRNKEIDGVLIKEIPLHKDGFIILVKRGKEMFIPHGDSYFKTGDVINIFGTNSALEDIRAKLASS